MDKLARMSLWLGIAGAAGIMIMVWFVWNNVDIVQSIWITAIALDVILLRIKLLRGPRRTTYIVAKKE